MAPMRIAALVGAAGLAVSVVAIVVDPSRALLGYLAAYCAVAFTAIGALVLLLIGQLTSARWLIPLRRLQESLVIVFPVLALLFVPIAVGLEHVYVWAEPGADIKRPWLSPASFIVRGMLYLAVFTIAAEVLRRRPHHRVFAAGMLPPVGLALTFAAFDWLMSLQPAWFSSMFGVYVFAGGFAAGIALLAVLTQRLHARGVASITRHHFHAIGRLLFAFVVFWTYTAYFQGFLIQIADRPNEVTFYIARLRGGWDILLWLVIALRFVLPFALLLPRQLKMRPRYVAAVSWIVIAGHVLDIYWLVIPTHDLAISPHVADIAALGGIAGLCIAFSLWRLRNATLLPVDDPSFEHGARYESPT